MYHVTINGTFEVVADREELYNLLEQQEGLREAVKLLRDLDKEQKQENKVNECELLETIDQTNDFVNSLLKDIETLKKTLNEVKDMTDLSLSEHPNFSRYWRCE